jgi:putative oxidoreductase
MNKKRIIRIAQLTLTAVVALTFTGHAEARNHHFSDKIIIVGPADLPELARVIGQAMMLHDTDIVAAYPPMEGQEMDWKRLIQFALLGSSDLEQYAILLVRVSIGLFFAISGANKLFSAGGIKPVYDTLVQAKVPFPHLMAYFVSGVEFVCGSLVTVGFLSSPASAALLIDMIVAILTNTLATLPKGLSRLNWLDDVLYLPEVLYVLFFIWLICSGPGKFSVDYWLAAKLLR